MRRTRFNAFLMIGALGASALAVAGCNSGPSDQTVKNHISRIFVKLNLSGRAQIAAHAIRVGIA